VIAIRYADDSVVGFEKKETALRFLDQLRERLAKFGLSLHQDKTRLIEFGRFAAERRSVRGNGRPETFDFLGFTHCCGQDRQGRFRVVRLTVKKRMRATLTGKRGFSGRLVWDFLKSQARLMSKRGFLAVWTKRGLMCWYGPYVSTKI